MPDDQDRLDEMMARALAKALAERERDKPPAVPARPIDPDTLYTPAEAATLLGLRRTKSMSEIPTTDLPKCKVGPARGSVRYLGADLLAYARGLAVPDLQPVLDAARERLEGRLERPVVLGAVGEGLVRRRIV